jgi:ribosomal protein L35
MKYFIVRGGPFDFWGGGGGGRFRKKISCKPRRKKKIMQHTIEKKNIMQKRALKNNPTCNSYTDLLQYCVHRLARFFRHICLKEHMG